MFQHFDFWKYNYMDQSIGKEKKNGKTGRKTEIKYGGDDK
jgi:hypothetical protein